MDDNLTPSPTPDSSQSAASTSTWQRVEKMREAERQSQLRKKIIAVVSVAAVLALIVGIAAYAQSRRDPANADAAQAPAASNPPNERGGIYVGQADAPITVTEYFDFMCPYCEMFRSQTSAYLHDLESQGKVRVEYIPLSFLDRHSQGTKYSTRAAAAAYCVNEENPTLFSAFYDKLLSEQPSEGTPGLTNQAIAEKAKAVGASEKALQCITQETHTTYVAQKTAQSSQDGVDGTPAVFVNGSRVRFTSDTPDFFLRDLKQAIEQTGRP